MLADLEQIQGSSSAKPLGGTWMISLLHHPKKGKHCQARGRIKCQRLVAFQPGRWAGNKTWGSGTVCWSLWSPQMYCWCQLERELYCLWGVLRMVQVMSAQWNKGGQEGLAGSCPQGNGCNTSPLPTFMLHFLAFLYFFHSPFATCYVIGLSGSYLSHFMTVSAPLERNLVKFYC